MLKIRLTRRGKKNSPFFRLVVAEHSAPIKGKFIEVLGFVNPKTKEKGLEEDRIKYWIEKGAQCSDSAYNLLVKAGVIKGSKRAIKMKRKPVEPASVEVTAGKEEKKEEVAPEKKEAAEPEKKEAETEKLATKPVGNGIEMKEKSPEVLPAEEKKLEEKPEKTEEK